MNRRYSQGSGRVGERREQLSLRSRVNDHVKFALGAFGAEWTTLPRSLASWDILIPEGP